MLNWTDIAADVAEGMAEAGFPVTITRRISDETSYDLMNGAYAASEQSITGWAVVASDTPIRSVFPEYVAGPSDELLMINASDLRENDRITMQGRAMIVRKVKDLTGAAFLWHVVAR